MAMDVDQLPDGTQIAQKTTATNRFTNWRVAHTILNHLQYMVAYLLALPKGLVSGILLDSSGTALTVKYAKFSSAVATDAAVVTAVTGKKIRVLSVAISATAADNTIVFNSKGSGAGTAKSNIFYNKLETAVVLPQAQHGWFETAAGEGLSATVAGAGTVAGIVTYVEV